MGRQEHKFTVGQVVGYASGFTLPQPRKDVTILKLLPPVGTSLQYRVRSESEAHDRVVLESALETL